MSGEAMVPSSRAGRAVTFMILGRKFMTWLGFGLEQHLWVATFTLGSLLAWVAIRTVSMKQLGRFLGEHVPTTSLSVLATETQVAKAWQIGQVMAAVGRNVPWECKCLAEALCVKWMLDHYRIPSVTFLGAYLAPEDAKGMKAHAWLAVGPKIVIGGRLSPLYQVTAVFAQMKF